MRALILLFAVFVLAIIALYWNEQAKPGRWDEQGKPTPKKISNRRGSLSRRGDAA
jgi:hypothetical protein